MKRLLSVLVLSATFSIASQAQSWPTQTVKIIVPVAAGSSVDVVARIVAEKLGEKLGQNVIVDNRGGAGGTIGTDVVAKSQDGHTFLLGYNGPLTVAPSIFPKLPYHPAKDLQPVILAVTQPNVLAVRSDLGVNSVKELVAKLKANPGKIDYASVGNGSLSHLAMEMLLMKSGTESVHIPFNGGPAAILALGRGDVHMLFAALSNLQPLLKQGQIKLLAVSNSKRSIAAPELPTIAEQGFDGFDATTWNGFMAPANASKESVERMNKAIGEILAMPEVKQRLLTAGAEVAGGTSAQFAELLKKETASWASVIKHTGIKAD